MNHFSYLLKEIVLYNGILDRNLEATGALLYLGERRVLNYAVLLAFEGFGWSDYRLFGVLAIEVKLVFLDMAFKQHFVRFKIEPGSDFIYDISC